MTDSLPRLTKLFLVVVGRLKPERHATVLLSAMSARSYLGGK
jgi:hypothetical protein